MQDELRAAYAKLTNRVSLTQEEARSLFAAIMSGNVEGPTIAALLGALAARGECVDELVGAAQAMRAGALAVRSSAECIDTCGTGGDGISTFNVSTAAAIVASAAGATVAKHGNRSTTRASGSTEVLERLGIDVEAERSVVERCLVEAGIGYLNARLLHPAMKHAAPARQAIPGRTIFNLLGPLTNPAGAKRQVVGVPRPELVGLMAEALLRLGAVHAWVVHGTVEALQNRGICDVTITGKTKVAEVKDGKVQMFSLESGEVGIPSGGVDELLVRSAEESAEVLRRVLEGVEGEARNQTLLNAGAALVVAGLAEGLRAGVALASEAIDAGRARAKLEEWRRLAPAKAGGHDA